MFFHMVNEGSVHGVKCTPLEALMTKRMHDPRSL